MAIIPPHSAPVSAPSAVRAFGVLAVQSFQRLGRVQQMGFVSFALLALIVLWVSIVTNSAAGWELPERKTRRGLTYRQYAEQELLTGRLNPARYEPNSVVPITPYEVPAVFNPIENGVQTLLLSIPHAVLSCERFVKDYGFMNFSGWVIFGAYLGFVLPLFTLSYATAAFGAERESRSLVWLMTRPIPRSGIYLAKFLGALPWCLAFGVGGFAVICFAGGEHGRTAFWLYWPAAAAVTVAFTALFHLIGAVFKWPVVVGLVYVFFFESLVATLPGSLKLLSLTFYARSLMYNAAEKGGYPVDLLEFTQPASTTTGWIILVVAAVALTALGMWLFSRSEYRDDV
jgi:ABC-type transport system involved in multi-copper enzyme maturation permease subunit